MVEGMNWETAYVEHWLEAVDHASRVGLKIGTDDQDFVISREGHEGRPGVARMRTLDEVHAFLNGFEEAL